MGYWQYTYDPNGNLLTQIDAKGQTVTFVYDQLNRVTSKTYSTGDAPVTYAYDTANPNGKGKIYSVTKGNAGTYFLEYDSMGRVKKKRRSLDGSNYDTDYIYDLSGRPTRMTYPNSYYVDYSYYPGTGFLDMVTGSDAVQFAKLSLYEPSGKVGQVEHANETATRNSYDPYSGRLLSIVTEDPSGQPQNDLQRKAYGYTAAGDVHTTSDELRGIAYTYTYDSLHRMLTETNNGGQDSITYQYNSIGNITSRQVGSNTFTYTYDTAKKHAVKTINLNGNNYTFNYDGNGNMTAGFDFTDPANVGTRTITYNADNLPSQIQYTNGSTVISTYLYDGDGARWKKAVQGGSTTYYIGSHYEVSGGVATLYIFAGSTRIAQIKGVNKNYFHKDHLGSSTKTSNSAGAGVETTEYMPFGPMREHSGSTISNYKYTDQELDPETGLYFYHARYYDPIIGRFLSADTIVQNFSDPQTLNRYSYCINNPLVYKDPTGHFFWVIAGAVIGAVMAGAQSDWNLKAMAAGAVIGGVSAGVGSYVGGYVGGALGSELAAAAAGGAAAGATGGGLYAAYYGGNIGEGMLKGAAYGAGTSLVMYGAAWGAGRVYGWANPELSVPTAQSGETLAKANLDLNVSEDPILSDPRLEPEFERAWIETRGETPEAREQGGFVIDDPGNPVLRLPPGAAKSMDFPTSPPANARAWFHTHPFWRDFLKGDVLWEHPFEPSPADLAVNKGWNIPGYIFDRRGVIKMDQGSTRWWRWTNVP